MKGTFYWVFHGVIEIEGSTKEEITQKFEEMSLGELGKNSLAVEYEKGGEPKFEDSKGGDEMSITPRSWSEEDLAQIGKDMKLTTVFLNCETFSEKQMAYYPYELRKTYVAYFGPGEMPDDEPYEFYATDDEMAIWFLEQEFTTLPKKLSRKELTFIPVELKK